MRPKGFFGIIIISQILGRCKHHVNYIKVHRGPLGGLRGQASPDEQAERSLYQMLRRVLGALQWAREGRMFQVKLRHELLNSTLTMIQDKEGEPKGCSVF